MTTTDSTNLSPTPFYLWDTLATDSVADTGIDSVFMEYLIPTVDTATQYRPSLFVGHSLIPKDNGFTPRLDSASPMWVFPLLLVLVGLVTLFVRQRKLRLRDLLHSLVDSRVMDRVQRNNGLLHANQLVPMGLLMLATLALPLHQQALARTGIVGYLLMTVALVAAYLLRNGVMRLLGSIFENSSAVNTYITNNYFYHFVLAALAMPLLFPLFYFPYGKEVILYVLAGLILAELMMRLFRGMQLFLTHSSGAKFYLFYYLCIVEIAPILVLIKWIIE